MAYMSQEKKAKIAPVVKAICKKYGVKASLAVHNHSSLVLNIKSGEINFIGNYNRVMGNTHHQVARGFRPVTDQYLQVNTYWFREHFDGAAKDFLTEVIRAMNDGNHDNSRIEVDYFDVGWYVNVNVGRWNKPYIVT